jgi:hypothetical protein
MHLDDIKKVIEILHPNVEVDYIFDANCIHEMNIVFSEGKPFFDVRVTYHKVKCIIKGNSFYIPAFNETRIPFMEFRTQFMQVSCDISPEFLSKLKSAYDMKMLNRPNHGFYDQLESLKNLSGLSENEIKQKAGIPL